MSDQFSKAVSYDNVHSGNNFVLGLLAGVVAAAIGAAVWMGLTVATGWHVGYVAIGVGALVGFAIRTAGKGTTVIFGIMGAVLTFLGCLSGEVMAAIQLSTSAQENFLDVLKSADLVQLVSSILSNTDPIMYLIYGFGIFEGYKLSIRK
jgi:hypothetical protein